MEDLATLAPKSSVADFVRAHSSVRTVVAADAPLVIVKAGQRACETAVGKKYGSRQASCHTSNLRLYFHASSVARTAELLAESFTHVDPTRS
ncbi:MAG: DUF429 domain-containing protein, partial [Pyrinomonadaceae bacterium]